MDFHDFASDDKTIYAVVRTLEIIGEATKLVPREVRHRHTNVPWRLMARMRDKLIHNYIGVNPEVVWRTVTEDLPGLKEAIQAILNEEVR